MSINTPTFSKDPTVSRVPFFLYSEMDRQGEQAFCLSPTLVFLLTIIYPRCRIPQFLFHDFMQHTHNAAWHTFHNTICSGAHTTEWSMNSLLKSEKRVRVIHGDNDDMCPLQCSLDLSQRYSNVSLSTIKRANHITVVLGREEGMAKDIEEEIRRSQKGYISSDDSQRKFQLYLMIFGRKEDHLRNQNSASYSRLNCIMQDQTSSRDRMICVHLQDLFCLSTIIYDIEALLPCCAVGRLIVEVDWTTAISISVHIGPNEVQLFLYDQSCHRQYYLHHCPCKGRLFVTDTS